MYTVFMKGDSLIFQSGFESYREAEAYGWNVFGPGNFEIEREQCTKKQYKYCASCLLILSVKVV